jgi:hypothetical protein
LPSHPAFFLAPIFHHSDGGGSVLKGLELTTGLGGLCLEHPINGNLVTFEKADSCGPVMDSSLLCQRLFTGNRHYSHTTTKKSVFIFSPHSLYIYRGGIKVIYAI